MLIGGGGGGAGTLMLIAGISMWMLFVLVFVLTLLPLPPPLDDEPVPPEGAPVGEEVCPVEALCVVCGGWAGVWPEEVEVAPSFGDEGGEVAAGGAEDAAEEACCPGEDEGISEEVASCDTGGVEEDEGGQSDDVVSRAD